jgi:hypothetical protein
MGSRRPMGRRQRPALAPPETPDYGPEPLYAVFRNGRRVYLRGGRPGISFEIAEAQARALGEGAEVVEIYGGREE